MATPEPIRFTYTYSDYQALNRLMRMDSLWKRTQFIRVPLAAALGVAGIVMLEAVFRGRDLLRTFSVLVATWQYWAFIVLSIPLAWLLNRLELWVYYRRQRLDGTLITVIFDDERGVLSESPTGAGSIPWSGVRKLVSDADAHVLLYENRMIGLCLPRRAFASQQAFVEVADYIAARLAQEHAA
jgi:hypothetical protein